MERDVKEVVGVLMRILSGGKTSRAEIEDLAYEASGELKTAVNLAYIRLLEVGYDHDAGHTINDKMRTELQAALDEIVRLAEA
jgi:hypothetical protein